MREIPCPLCGGVHTPGYCPQQEVEKEGKERQKASLEEELRYALEKFYYHHDRLPEIFENARVSGVELNISQAFLQGLERTLIQGRNTENLKGLALFAKEHQLVIEDPHTIRVIEEAFADCYAGLDNEKIKELKSFIEDLGLPIDTKKMFLQGFHLALQHGWGERASHLVRRAQKESVVINFQSLETIQAFFQGCEKTLRDGWAADTNRILNLAKKLGAVVDLQTPEITEAAKAGMRKCLENLPLGPGCASFAEQMYALIKKQRIPIDMKSQEMVAPLLTSLKKIKEKGERFPPEIQAMSGGIDADEFLKKIGIDL